MKATTSQAGFLDLPTEIKEIIYDLIAQHCLSPEPHVCRVYVVPDLFTCYLEWPDRRGPGYFSFAMTCREIAGAMIPRMYDELSMAIDCVIWPGHKPLVPNFPHLQQLLKEADVCYNNDHDPKKRTSMQSALLYLQDFRNLSSVDVHFDEMDPSHLAAIVAFWPSLKINCEIALTCYDAKQYNAIIRMCAKFRYGGLQVLIPNVALEFLRRQSLGLSVTKPVMYMEESYYARHSGR
ncbi:hypothetical protein ANO11243_051070 [Dothideomycetidae sp. 11243]|nr:hypothetical protein ANO11243_051070 [fungal sp. No.11243]